MKWAAVLPALLAVSPPAHAALLTYQVDGDSIARPLTGHDGDPARGRQIVLNREVGTCLLCHSGPFPEERFQGTIGPNLSGVGARLSEGQLRLRVVDPQLLNPDSVMPAYYVTDNRTRVGKAFQGKPVLTAEQVEDVVAFLTTLRTP